MIISLNGRIGSGKDTVCKIIQMLVVNQKFTGYLKERKLEDIFEDKDLEKLSGWQNKKFAAKLKQIASLLTGIEIEKFESQDFKKTYLPDEWDGMQVRTFLQKLGTECVRDNLHTNTLVNALFSDYKFVKKDGMRVYPDWIITDMRFPNEFASVEERGGITIKINRELPDEGYKTLEKLHPSETALDSYPFLYTINNNGSLEELMMQVRNILLLENIL